MAGGASPAAAAALAARNSKNGIVGSLGNAGRVNGVDTNGASTASVPYKTPAQQLAAKKAAQTAGKTRLVNTGKPGTSGSPGWLSAWVKSHSAPGSAATGTWDPLSGMPTSPELTPFPAFDSSTLPDGSSVPYVPGHTPPSRQAALLDPNSYASKAMQSFAPLIKAIMGQQQSLQGGEGQANNMIDQSFGQAANSALAGAKVVGDSNTQANQSLTDLAARMASAAGGDPTAAAAVGQSTANQQGADDRLAQIDQQAQAATAAAANRDAGTAKLAYKGVTDKAISDLALQGGQAQQQASAAGQTALKDALGFNSDQQTAQQGRDTAKQEAWLAGQIAGPQIEAARLSNVASRQGLLINKDKTAVNDWTTLNNATRTKYLDSVTQWTNKNVANQMKDALVKGKTPGAEIALADPNAYHSALSDWLSQNSIKGAGPAANPATLMSSTVQQMKAQYPDSTPDARKVLAYRFVASQLNAWNAYHPKMRYADKNGNFTPIK